MPETRRIGEAQTRAYVNIKLVNFGFREGHPIILITPFNSGSSPARNFVWEPTVRYSYEDRPNAEGGFSFEWRSGAGIMIPAASDAPVPSVLMPGISVREFADSREPTTNTVAVRLLVRFEYRDVFDNLISDEAVFLGMAHRLNNVYEQGGNMAWSADLSLERSGPTTLFSPEQQREKRDAN